MRNTDAYIIVSTNNIGADGYTYHHGQLDILSENQNPFVIEMKCVSLGGGGGGEGMLSFLFKLSILHQHDSTCYTEDCDCQFQEYQLDK